MAETGIVRLNASLSVTAAAAQDYSTLLIVDCNHTSFDRTAVYASPDDYSTIEAGTPLKRALDSAFSASIRPAQVIAGRSKGKAVLTPEDVADGEQYGVTVTVTSEAVVAASHTAGAAETAEDVCTALKADIDAVTEATDEIGATVVGVGADAVLEIVFNTSEDDFILSGLTENLTLSSEATEAVADSLSAIGDSNSQWTWIAATDHTPSYQVSIMSQAEVLQKPYVTSMQLEEGYAPWNGEDTPDSNDVGAIAKFNNYDYTHVMYHNNADELQAENVRLTQFSSKKPGTSNFQYKSLSGVPLAQEVTGTTALTTTDLFNLETKSMSTTVSLGGQTVVGGRVTGTGNRMASGVRMEAIQVLIWTRQEIARKLETLLLVKDKMALNDSDINLITKTIRKFFTENASGGGVSRAFREDRPVDIIAPKAKDISFEDQVEGILRNFTVIGYLDPSIDSVEINLNLTYLNPVEA